MSLSLLQSDSDRIMYQISYASDLIKYAGGVKRNYESKRNSCGKDTEPDEAKGELVRIEREGCQAGVLLFLN